MLIGRWRTQRLPCVQVGDAVSHQVRAEVSHQRTPPLGWRVDRSATVNCLVVTNAGVSPFRDVNDAAGTLLPTYAPAAYYLALRAGPIFGADGVRDADLPDFQDTAFHLDVATRRHEVEQSARRNMDMSTTPRVERITQLDTTIPQVRALAAWLQLVPLVKGPLNHVSTNEGGVRGLINSIGLLFFGGLFVYWIIGFFVWE